MTMTDPEASLEEQLIRDYLRERGYDQAALDALSESDRRTLLAAASEHASDKLAEIEARTHFLRTLSGFR
jgi:hypothetical protein